MAKHNTLKTETRVLGELDEAIKSSVKRNGGRGIRLRCGAFNLASATRCVKGTGSGKADFVIGGQAVDDEKLFISHKAEGFSHNGYGSGGSKAFPSRSPFHSERAWNFVRWAVEHCRGNPEHGMHLEHDGLLRWTGRYRGVWCIPPEEVKRLVVYGPKPRAPFGPLNCHLSAVGDPIFSVTNGDGGLTLHIDFPSGLCSNGVDLPGGDDEPIICIAAPIGAQKHEYLLTPDASKAIRGFHGWLGFFPYRLIAKAEQAAAAGRAGGKGADLERVVWPNQI